MADLSDVQTTIVNLVGGILYPSGPGGSSIVGLPVRVFRGWPNSGKLDADLKAGISQISVWEQPGYTRLTGGYLDPSLDTPGVATITATVTGATVTFTGTPGLGQVIGVIVDGSPYAYALTANDTLTTAAAALAALVNIGPDVVTDYQDHTIEWLTLPLNGGNLTDGSGFAIDDGNGNPISTNGAAFPSGPSITFATNRPIEARTGANGTTQSFETDIVQGFRITVWAPSHTARDTITAYIDARLRRLHFINLSDGQRARFQWRNTYSDDAVSKDALWKRDLFYTVQYATSVTDTAYVALFVNVNSFGLSHNPTLN